LALRWSSDPSSKARAHMATPLSIGEAPAVSIVEMTTMMVTASCEMPAMEDEELASSPLEVATTGASGERRNEESILQCKET